MPVFDLTLKGFGNDIDSSTKWVSCDDKQVLEEWLREKQLSMCVKSCTQLGSYTNSYNFQDGVDVILVKMSTGFIVTQMSPNVNLENWKNEKEYNYR